MKCVIGKRYRLSSAFKTHHAVGVLITRNGEKCWEIKTNDGAIYYVYYEFYNAICKW